MSSPRSRPCTIFLRSENLRLPGTQISPANENQNTSDWLQKSPNNSHSSDSKPRQSDELDSRNHATYKRAADTNDTSNKRHVTQFCKERSPWTSYKKFATLGPSETTFLAIGWNPTPTIVAVKGGESFGHQFTSRNRPNKPC